MRLTAVAVGDGVAAVVVVQSRCGEREANTSEHHDPGAPPSVETTWPVELQTEGAAARQVLFHQKPARRPEIAEGSAQGHRRPWVLCRRPHRHSRGPECMGSTEQHIQYRARVDPDP